MFGILNIDFNLLNNDYIYIKSVIVPGNESNNSSIKFERIMNLLNNSKISTIQISNIHLTNKSFDCIMDYISNDNNYDTENYLQNSVNQFILHRKSGLKYDIIQNIYSKQFQVCGWNMSFDSIKQYVIITLNFHASWEYIYDEDYDEDEQENKQQHINTSKTISKSISPRVLNSQTTIIKENKNENDDEYEYYYEDENGDEYEYYYEDENTNTHTHTHTKPPPAVTKILITAAPKEPETMRVTSIMDNVGGMHMNGTGMNGLGGLGGLGLPPPDSDEDTTNTNENIEENKIKFLSEVLTNENYEGRVLFNFSSGILMEIISLMQRWDVCKGQCIMKETEYGQNYDLKFFVIEYGVFNIYQQGKKLPGIELFGGLTFGETHLTYGIPQYVTIRASTNKCLVWYLNRSIYFQISWKYFHKPFKNRIKTKFNEFNIITTLGIGSFGRVLLIRDPNSKHKKTYSLKKISKNNVIKNNQQKHIMNERSVMSLISEKDKKNKGKKYNTFCCKLYGLYQDTFYLYFLMEPLLGGELFTLLRHNKTFSEKVARFYLSCVIIAFEHLHNKNIIYRDIKPENIMLTSNGYCKLVDFGLAKLRNNTVTLCGTPEYLAPEVIQNYWQGFELDFWGLGILLYEMVYGNVPFNTYEQILRQNVPHPQIINGKPLSQELIKLINNLLVKNPYQRLGTTANKRKGINEIYKHEWFENTMEWNALKAQKFKPPYIPDIENNEDASHFEEVDSDDENTKKENEMYINNDPTLYKWCEYF